MTLASMIHFFQATKSLAGPSQASFDGVYTLPVLSHCYLSGFQASSVPDVFSLSSLHHFYVFNYHQYTDFLEGFSLPVAPIPS